MNKPIFCLLLLILAGSLFALDGVTFGVGGEANGSGREAIAAGGVLSIGLDIIPNFSIGIKKAYYYDFDLITVMEDTGFFRWYPLNKFGLFIQAELGTMIYFEDSNSSPAFQGGFAAGWRFLFPQNSGAGMNFYLEPYVRGGYPYLWGGGILMGVRVNNKTLIREED